MTTSRRDFLTTSVAAAILAALDRPTILQGRLLQAQEPAFTTIRRNVSFFTMRGGTIGYLVNAGGVVVVDSQFPAEASACIEGLSQQSGGRPVDFLVNTHHHGDHSGGNISFRGVAEAVVAHVKADEHMRLPPGGEPPADQLFPAVTFTEAWSEDVGDERVVARHYGRAHTSGDAVITFERANVVHMGDLMFNQRHPVVDRAAGATIRNWMTVLERSVGDHSMDTVYIFGHANAGCRSRVVRPISRSSATISADCWHSSNHRSTPVVRAKRSSPCVIRSRASRASARSAARVPGTRSRALMRRSRPRRELA